MSSPITAQWRCLRPLGRGASGAAVSLALDPSSGLLFAVKSTADRIHDHILRRELSILSSLPPHPHLIPLLGSSVTTNCSNSGGAGPADTRVYHRRRIFLSYAPGGAVADQIRLRGRLDELAIRRHVFGVVSALAHVHAHSVAHCDVKPDNILVGGDGGAILADFGCARRCVEGEPLRGEAVMGTPTYLSPEAARGEEQGPAADVWALGCAAIEMATGSSPYSGGFNMDGSIALLYRIGYDECYAPQAPAWLSEEAQDFVRRCLRRDPRERPTAAELLRHPFVAADQESGFREKQKLLRISPRSTLEESFFCGGSETGEDEVEEIAEWQRSDGGAGRRIGELAGAGRGSDAPEWTGDDEGWIAVRGCGRDCDSTDRCVADVFDDDDDDNDDDNDNDDENDNDDDLGSGGLNEGIVAADDEEERLLLGEEGSCGYTVLNMAPAVERRERSRRSPPPARSNSLERERRSPRRRSSPRRERSPNHRRDRSPVRTSSSHRVRSPPVKEKLPEWARSPKHHRPRSPVGNGASCRSPSPPTKRRDGSRDRREDREKNDGGGLGRLSRRDRSISPEEHGRKARHGSRSPPRTSKAGERDEASRSRDTVANRVGDNDSVTKMNAAAEALEEKDKHKPSFELSGKLAEETNRVRGITLLFTEPPEARKPEIRWRFMFSRVEKCLMSCYLFGRERRIADIPTDHPSCSKQHAVLQYRLVEKEQPDGLMSKQVRPYLMDLDSTNGTFINDSRIEPRRYYELFEKDTVKFGNSSREYVLLHENSAG
uniref:Protein kinase domain-containing protein n=1 Tax=Ananas comosus var. bracteatus TaxID=296719 RepID=A0A6V7Q388_ANACO|nr:unnamed protein product [Ananas comosus var. bracteatus]